MSGIEDVTDYTGLPRQTKSEARRKLEELRRQAARQVDGDELTVFESNGFILIVNEKKVIRYGVAQALLHGLEMERERHAQRHH